MACTFIHTQFLRVWALKALARLSAQFKHLRLIVSMLSIQNHMSWSIFLNKAALFIYAIFEQSHEILVHIQNAESCFQT